jgi:glycosyltransferase involved in cell wall biosynthesis
MPLVTVVTVVRNGEASLEKTILSVINQTYTNIEYIIVDGASTDGTLEIIRKYEDKIDYWTSEPDGGIYDAMNKGIDFAAGEWINFMNSGDNFYNKNVIEETAGKHSDNNTGVLYGDTCFDNKVIRKSPEKVNAFFFLREHLICHQSIFARTKYLKSHFNTKYRIAADRDWLFGVYKQRIQIKHIPLVICNYDCSGISSNAEVVLRDLMVLIKEQYGIWGAAFVILKRFGRKIIRWIFRCRIFRKTELLLK